MWLKSVWFVCDCAITTGYGPSHCVNLSQLERMAGSMDEKWSIDKLDGSNWTTWKFQMRHLLLAKGLWGHADGTDVLEDGASDRARMEFRRSLRKPSPRSLWRSVPLNSTWLLPANGRRKPGMLYATTLSARR